jgi:hypothetical protein
MLIKFCIMTAKSAPYPPFPTEGDLMVKIKTSGRPELRRVTQPPFIAGPLVKMRAKELASRRILTNFE